jgi:hypothetical protein
MLVTVYCAVTQKIQSQLSSPWKDEISYYNRKFQHTLVKFLISSLKQWYSMSLTLRRKCLSMPLKVFRSSLMENVTDIFKIVDSENRNQTRRGLFYFHYRPIGIQSKIYILWTNTSWLCILLQYSFHVISKCERCGFAQVINPDVHILQIQI